MFSQLTFGQDSITTLPEEHKLFGIPISYLIIGGLILYILYPKRKKGITLGPGSFKESSSGRYRVYTKRGRVYVSERKRKRR